MIILDTNIISALMTATPDPIVIGWLNQFNMSQLWITTITVMEVEYGIARLSNGRKQNVLKKAFKALTQNEFKNQILSFDESAAFKCAKFTAERISNGFNMSVPDCQIAGITLANKGVLATRDKHFENCGIEVINPWNV